MWQCNQNLPYVSVHFVDCYLICCVTCLVLSLSPQSHKQLFMIQLIWSVSFRSVDTTNLQWFIMKENTTVPEEYLVTLQQVELETGLPNIRGIQEQGTRVVATPAS